MTRSFWPVVVGSAAGVASAGFALVTMYPELEYVHAEFTFVQLLVLFAGGICGSALASAMEPVDD